MQPALEKLYSGQLPAVCGFLVRAGARRSELEDLAHDVFVTAARRWSSYDQTRPALPWLLGIAHRVLLDSRRRASSTREVNDEAPDVAAEDDAIGDRLRTRDAQALVHEALQSLEPDRRTTFILCELQSLSPAEVAEAMGTPVATTYSRLRVAREEFTAAVRRIQLRRGDR
jgi:RNA polymerase sigma-70 factor (ECF subfamily)